MSENIVPSNSVNQNEPFANYEKHSRQPGPAFYAFIVIYTLSALLSIAPLVSWSRNKVKKKKKILDSDKKQVEVEQSKNPNSERPPSDDHNEGVTPYPSIPLSRRGEKNEKYGSNIFILCW